MPLIITQGQNNVALFNPTQRPTWNGNVGRAMTTRAEDEFNPTQRPTWNGNYANLGGSTGGRFNAQFRAEFFNAFNRVQFSPPGTRVDSINFGVVGGQANSPRQVQLSLKLAF